MHFPTMYTTMYIPRDGKGSSIPLDNFMTSTALEVLIAGTPQLLEIIRVIEKKIH